MEKICSKCGQKKPAANFNKNRRTIDGYGYWCRACINLQKSAKREKYLRAEQAYRADHPEKVKAWRFSRKAWAIENPDKISEYNLRAKFKRYGITQKQFSKILNLQNGKCALCKSDFPTLIQWTIDHDHRCCRVSCKSCGKCIRGILCGKCNSVLGYLKDNIETARAIPRYLLKPPAQRVLGTSPSLLRSLETPDVARTN